jgi:hypothetical protein
MVRLGAVLLESAPKQYYQVKRMLRWIDVLE